MATGESPGASIPIRLTRTRPEPDANVQAGYAKLQGNQFDAARHDYEQALKTDPNNVDTLLALAAIAQRQGRSADADRYQQRAINADPRDPAAQAAVLGGTGRRRPDGQRKPPEDLCWRRSRNRDRRILPSATFTRARGAGPKRSRSISTPLPPMPTIRITCSTWRSVSTICASRSLPPSITAWRWMPPSADRPPSIANGSGSASPNSAARASPQ